MAAISILAKIFSALNLRAYCRERKINSLWQCPPFIFMVMGVVIISSILATYFVTRIYVDPLIVAVIICIVTVVLFILSYIVVRSFERMMLLSREKSEFISIVSHQLRTPLSSVKWQLDLLRRGGASLTGENGQKALSLMDEQNNRMIRTVNDMLEVNRLENDNLVFDKTIFLLADLIGDVVERYKKEASFAGVEIIFSLPNEEIKVEADSIRLGTVISHLLDNAIKYSPNGGKVSIFLEKVPGHARFSITDEGVGISKEDAEQLFKKFCRGSSSRKYKSDGLGLGLYLSKFIIESFGGKIGFSSIEGRGSTFWFILPIKKT